MKTNLRYWIWTNVLMAVVMLTVVMALHHKVVPQMPGKHIWVDDECGKNIDLVCAELRKHKWMDTHPKNLDDFVSQLNQLLPTRLSKDFSTYDDIQEMDFRNVFSKIDGSQTLDRGLRGFLSELELDLTVKDGVLVIGHADDQEMTMLRVYSMPDVAGRSLIMTIENVIVSEQWQSGDLQMWVQENETQTRTKLVVRAHWATHRKIERYLDSLIEIYGWKSDRLPTWFDTMMHQLAPSKPSPGMGGVMPGTPPGMGGGMMMGGTGTNQGAGCIF